jgi:Flp pilus assembly protein TadG
MHHALQPARAHAPKQSLLRRFWCNELGIAVVEFGLVLPVLMTLFYGTVEVTRYILITQKVEKLAHSVADMTAQEQVATQSMLNQVMAAASNIMDPFTMTNNGTIFITAMYRAPSTTTPLVMWSYQGGGTFVAASKLGTVGSTATVPGFTFDDRENLIAAEVYYQFSPLISSQFFGTTTVYRTAYYKPRLGALLTPPV